MNGGPVQPDLQERDPDGSIVRYLISKGANINATDIFGQTPLHFAAMRGNEVACSNLLFFKDKIEINVGYAISNDLDFLKFCHCVFSLFNVLILDTIYQCPSIFSFLPPY